MADASSNMLPVTDFAPAWGISSQGAHKFLREKNFSPIMVGKRSYLSPEIARAAMLARGFQYPKKVLSMQMLKGGVGKTTSVINIGLRASMYGAKVLLIDLDQQANLSFAFGVEDEGAGVWADVIEGKSEINSLIRNVSPQLDLIPSNLNNSILDKVLLNGKRNVALGVSQALAAVRDQYDWVILDTAPNLNAINTAAACAADIVVLPVNPDRFSFDGLRKTVEDLKDIKREFGVDFEVKVLFSKFDGRETSSRALLQKCLSEYGNMMFSGFIRTSSDLKNTIRSGSNIFSRKSTAKEDYDIVTRELLNFTD